MMLRRGAAVLAALLLASAPPGAAQSELGNAQQDGNVIAVPPAPALVPAPPAPLAPAPLAPATPAQPPPPPGLVPLGPLPGGEGNGSNAAENGGSPAPAGASEAGASEAGGAAAPAGNPQGNAGNATENDAAAGNAAPSPQDQDVIPTPPNAWQPEKTAKLGVLDKVNGGESEISVPVGGQAVVGDMQVSVLACFTRPASQIPDAAVFLSLQGTADSAGAPAFRGWLLRSEPGAAVAGDGSEVFRIVACS